MSSTTSPKAQLEALLDIITKSAKAAIAEYEKSPAGVPSPLATEPHPLDLEEAPNVALIKAVRVLEGACDQLCTTLAPPPRTLVNRAQVFYWAAFKVSQQARIPHLLKGHPEGVSAEELSKQTGIETKKLTRILRLLAAKSLYIELSPGVFAHSRLSANLVTGFHLSDTADLHLVENSPPAINLHPYLTSKRGASYAGEDSAWCQHNNDIPFWSHTQSKDDKREAFGRAMVGVGKSMGMLASLHHYPWEKVKSVGDIGGGIGGFSSKLIKQHAHINVELHDLPETIEDARAHWEKNLQAELATGRVKFTGYNFLEGPPAKDLDVYFYRTVLHNWPDDACVTILKNCSTAMGPHSRIVVQEYILHNPAPYRPDQATREQNTLQPMAPEPMLPNYGAGNILQYQLDLCMMELFNSKQRTLADFEALGAQAGLKITNYYDLGNSGLLEFALA